MNPIDVVIVAYNSDDHIDRCLAAVRRLPNLGEIVVVDNNVENRGFGGGQNHGVGQTTAEWILLLNPDAEIVPDAVERGRDVLRRSPDVAAVQGVIVNAATNAPERSQGRAIGPIHLVGRALGLRSLLRIRPVRAVARRVPAVADHVDRSPSKPLVVESLAATAVLVRSSAFDHVGGFDERYFLYGEDVDFCRRLRNAGWVLLALPDVWARHQSGASSATDIDRERRWWAGTMRYATTWWSPAALAVARTAAAVAWMRIVVRRPRVARPAWREMVRAGQ